MVFLLTVEGRVTAIFGLAASFMTFLVIKISPPQLDPCFVSICLGTCPV
jgi:hypothetical protein